MYKAYVFGMRPQVLNSQVVYKQQHSFVFSPPFDPKLLGRFVMLLGHQIKDVPTPGSLRHLLNRYILFDTSTCTRPSGARLSTQNYDAPVAEA